MRMTDRCECCIIVDQILVLCLVGPVDRIDLIRLVVAVLHALLVTVEFLTCEDERNSLRCVNRCLSKLYHCKTLSFSRIGSFLETVAQTVVVVAAHIAHVLERVVCPTLYGHLRMLDATCDTEMDVLLVSCNTVHETGILASERAADCVANVVAERSDLVHHMGICLEGDLLGRISRRRSRPAFAVNHDIRVDGVEALADKVHGLDVMDGHEVEAEAVDMIFLHPPLERLDHEFLESLLL